MAELKLQRLQELCENLRKDLARHRIPVSEAVKDLLSHCKDKPDGMVSQGSIPKSEDPYAPQQSGGCCVVM